MIHVEKGTLRYEIERIRFYIVDAIMNEIRGNQLTKAQVQQISKDVLTETDAIKDKGEIVEALKRLSAKYKILEMAEIKELAYEEEQVRAMAATKVTELLRQGKLDEAGELAREYTK